MLLSSEQLGYGGVWMPDASALITVANSREAGSVSAALEVKARHTLFPVADMVTATPHRNWDVSPDGQSFAMVRFNPATRIMVIQQLPTLVARLQGAAH